MDIFIDGPSSLSQTREILGRLADTDWRKKGGVDRAVATMWITRVVNFLEREEREHAKWEEP